MDTYVPSIPPALSERLIWRDGSFHASEELKGDTLFARCSREVDVAVVPCRWYSPRAFEKNFGVHFMNKEGSINATVDAIVDLLRKAWTLRASDIHITYWGPYTTIELRRLGLLQPFQTLNGTEGQALILALFQSDISQGGGESTFSPLEQHDARIAKREYLPEGVFAVRADPQPVYPRPGHLRRSAPALRRYLNPRDTGTARRSPWLSSGTATAPPEIHRTFRTFNHRGRYRTWQVYTP